MVEARAACFTGVLIPKQRARVVVHGKTLADADGMRRQNRPISADVSVARDTMAHDHENMMI